MQKPTETSIFSVNYIQNTFRLKVLANKLAYISDLQDLLKYKHVIQSSWPRILFVSGASNIVFVNSHVDFPVFIMKEGIKKKGIMKNILSTWAYLNTKDSFNKILQYFSDFDIIKSDSIMPNLLSSITSQGDKIFIFAGSNLVWDKFVKDLLDNNIFGLENLSVIPGKVGGAVVQNIGAYGVEISQFIKFVLVLDLKTFKLRILDVNKCNYSYRHSIFKPNSFLTTKIFKTHQIKIKLSQYKQNRYLVLGAIFAFDKSSYYKPTLSYGNLKQLNMNVSPTEIRKIIINTRNAKTPSLQKFPSVGSFFTNPLVSSKFYAKLKQKHENIPGIKVVTKENMQIAYKIPAAWLIDNLGLKGFCINDACISKKHALFFVNNGNVTGRDVIKLAKIVINNVYKEYGVILEPEAVIVK